MVRRYVADRKPQIAVEVGKAPIEAFIPRTRSPGMEAEVGFGDVAVRLAGELVTLGIESFHCRPGVDGAHEKGGVEGRNGYLRHNRFAPVPEVSSPAGLNEMVEQWDLHDGRRRIGSRPRTIDEYFTLEQPLPLPQEPFEIGRVFTPGRMSPRSGADARA
jgi:hypothetical protein